MCDSPPSTCHEATGTCAGGTCTYAPLLTPACRALEPLAGTQLTTSANTDFSPIQVVANDAAGNAASNVWIERVVEAGGIGTFAGGATTARTRTDGAGIATCPVLRARTTVGTGTVSVQPAK